MGEKEACIGVRGVMPAVMGVRGVYAANPGVMPAIGVILGIGEAPSPMGVAHPIESATSSITRSPSSIFYTP